MAAYNTRSEGSKPTHREFPREFHLFPKLPHEVRLDIWELNLPIRTITGAFGVPPRTVEAVYGWRLEFFQTPVQLASVCKESRNLVLQKYEKLYARGRTDSKRHEKDPYILIDWSRDTLDLECNWTDLPMVESFLREGFRKLDHLSTSVLYPNAEVLSALQESLQIENLEILSVPTGPRHHMITCGNGLDKMAILLTVDRVDLGRDLGDNWVNATRILRVAGVPRDQIAQALQEKRLRTKTAAEKFQTWQWKPRSLNGLWIRYWPAYDLCRAYDVEGILGPLLSYGNQGGIRITGHINSHGNSK
ncbi:uncharacterized protein PAC_15178 [Phialocephala subalpina]|uniref:HTH APSES-type domain-containing protein n=1 Tax=Phialocephala subalpina TaxID=576137 RepID=A0A1L7XJU0_9HELO|nr:uncharacterized protein PAC_15178 [Phialocephala subalpina]